MKRIIIILLALLLSLIPMAAVADGDESLITFGIPIVGEIRLYITYYGGPLDPEGNGTTYLAGTEPEWEAFPDGTWIVYERGEKDVV